MWISKEHYDRLCGRLDDCERQLRAVSANQTIHIDKWPGAAQSWSNRFYELPAADAIRQLAAHCGVKFVYQSGTPDAAVLERQKK